jgi:hypothetical protein
MFLYIGHHSLRSEDGRMEEFVVCPVCNGEGGRPAISFGELGWIPCRRCHETGEVMRDAPTATHEELALQT